MRRALALLTLISLVVAIPALAAGTTKTFKGKTEEGGRLSFKLTKGRKYVKRFDEVKLLNVEWDKVDAAQRDKARAEFRRIFQVS